MPWWGALLIGFVSAGLAYIGSRQGTKVSARTADQLDRWRRREETMRMLRWAAEMAIDERNDGRAAVGTTALRALARSELLQPEDAELIDAISQQIIEPVTASYTGGDDLAEED